MAKKNKTFSNLELLDAKMLVDLRTYCSLEDVKVNVYQKAKDFNLPVARSNLPIYQTKMSGLYTQPELIYAKVENVTVCNNSYAIYLANYALRSEFGYKDKDSLILNNSQEDKVIYVLGFRSYTDKGLVNFGY